MNILKYYQTIIYFVNEKAQQTTAWSEIIYVCKNSSMITPCTIPRM